MYVCISNMYVCMHIKFILPTDKSKHVDHVHTKFILLTDKYEWKKKMGAAHAYQIHPI